MKNYTFSRVQYALLLAFCCVTSLAFSQTTIATYNFNSNIQGWSNNGNDSGRTTNGTWSCNSAGAIFSKDDETANNRITSPAINLSNYLSVDFSFCYKANGIDNGEGFKLEYSKDNGSNWTTIKTYISGTDFTTVGSGNPHSFSININTSTLPTQARFRFESTANQDTEYNYFDDITIKGYPIPEINLTGNANNIVSGATSTSTYNDTEFLSTDTATNVLHTFTIQNTTTGTTLNLTNTPNIVTIAGAPEFSISTQPSGATIAGGSNKTFVVTFNPTDETEKTATITITNNDTDESIYTFKIKGRVANVDNFGPGGEWKYKDDGSNQGTAWRATAFDDSAWASGNAELGFGDGDESTVINDLDQITNYFRKAFTVTAAQVAMSGLTLKAKRDDGMVVYVNGTEVWRDYMPTGTINYNTLATTYVPDDGDDWQTITLPNLLVAGTNVVAVEIHQNDSTSSDVSFNFDMELDNVIIPANGPWYYKDDGSNQGTAWQTANVTPTGANWASGNAMLGYGTIDGGTIATTVSYGSDSNNKYPTTYFRKTVTVSALDAANSTLTLKAVRDDGMVVYINGTEVWRDGMPTGTISYNTYASQTIDNTDESAWQTRLVPNILVAGTNEIAVEIHQVNATSSDISFDFEMFTDNTYIFIPPIQPDNDGDGIADYKDTDDDNDGITDLIEGCHSGQLEDLNSDPFGAGNEESIKANFPFSMPLEDGNSINYSTSGTFDDITSYDAGDHGWAIRVHGPNTAGTLSLNFANDVKNLSFRLVDFDEDETWTVNAYDDSNNLIDLTTDADVYFLGSYIQQTGNTFTDSTSGGSTNHNGEDINSDVYGTAYFYFPDIIVSRIDFVIDQPIGSTIRLAAIQYCNLDTDGDGIEDYHDLDSDNDGIPDLVEAGGVDVNGNGIANDLTDTDGDGLVDIYDNDKNNYNFGETSKLANRYDFDGDGIINSIDLDSDNDGIADIIEIGSTDANGDGQIDGFTDTDHNGYHDAYDGSGSRLLTGPDTDADGLPNSYPIANADNTGFPNFLDIDSDDDGITDNTEAQATNAFIAYSATDTDGDGIKDVYDNSGSFGGRGIVPVDSDIDGIPDYLDTDSDDGEEDDYIEGHDTNGDGVINGSDSPSANTGIFTGVDTDGDGLDDGYDNNNSTYDSSNASLQPSSHPIVDGGSDRDWRDSQASIDFDGFNDYIDYGNTHGFAADFSIEAWVLQQATVTKGTIMSKSDVKAGNLRGYSLSINNNYPNLTWYNDSGTKILDITSPYAITNNKWYHIAATYDGTTAILYVDGVEIAHANAAPSSNGNQRFNVGAMYDSSAPKAPKNHFNGYIDEVRVWDVALSPQQLHEMMNQEIEQDGTAVKGKVLPFDISGGLLWANLRGYYPMTADEANDYSNYNFDGYPKNILTTELQTAPLPYTTIRNGDWKDTNAATPWTYGNTVWNAPNAISIDGSSSIDWNIVRTSHNVKINTDAVIGRPRSVLGLLVDANTVTVDGSTNMSTGTGTGNGLTVTKYLKLDGNIDLNGDSQLIQTTGSILDPTSSGKLDKDQQGTADTFTYNYWASPVGTSNNSTNNNTYTIPTVLRDGTNPASPATITFATSGYNGAAGPPLKIADYWLWKFANQTDNQYSAWQHVRSTGSIKPGEGYTMKGTATGTVSDFQNYVFTGKPNNGDIGDTSSVNDLNLAAGNDYLVGNPYPSALDANQFIDDNGTTIDGTLYFWEHWGGGSHVLKEYEGGYAMYNKSGPLVAATINPDLNNPGPAVTTGSKIPGRYIPVGQGFFVVAQDGGKIKFNNGQRKYQKESSGNSLFMRNATANNYTTNSVDDVDNRMKFRFVFNSAKNYHRQLLLTIDENTTTGYDWAYDGKDNDAFVEDMYWMIDGEKYVIQGRNPIDASSTVPLGLHTVVTGENTIKIEALENVPESINIYVHDILLNTYHDLRASDYTFNLDAGTYLDRYEITFANSDDALSTADHELNNVQVYYKNANESIVLINPALQQIKTIELFNMLGQRIQRFDTIENSNHSEYQVRNLSTGTYIIKIYTETGSFSKKVLVK